MVAILRREDQEPDSTWLPKFEHWSGSRRPEINWESPAQRARTAAPKPSLGNEKSIRSSR